MKWIIPSEIQVGGHVVRIRRNEKVMSVAELRGHVDLPHGIIRLSFVLEGKPRVLPQLLESFLHEILHAIDHLYMRELDERQVGVLASGLSQVLQSMGLEADFSQIPEEEL